MSGIIEDLLISQKIRLKDYSSIWQKKTLRDLGEFIRGLSYTSDVVTENVSDTLIVRSNNIIQGKSIDFDSELVFVSKKPADEQILQTGDIVFCMANGSSELVGKNSYFKGKAKSNITVGAFCGIYRGTSSLTRWLLNTHQYQRAVSNTMQGGNGAIANLKGDNILNLSFYYPTEIKEEHKLISILSSFEKKIEIEEKLLNYYNKEKTALLQLMFI